MNSNNIYIKQLIFFFFTIFCILLCWEFLVFNEEIILLIASFIMFNLFIQVCFNALTEILVVRTNEIYFLFYDLFILKLEKLELYKLNILKKLNINKQLTEILQILKINLHYLNVIQFLFNFAFLNYLLYSLLENVILEEFKFLKLFLLKKLTNLEKKSLGIINLNINNIAQIKNIKTIYWKNLKNILTQSSNLDVNLLKFIINRLTVSKWYFYILYTQYLNTVTYSKLNNNINYISSLLLFFQNNQNKLYLSNNFYVNFKLKLFYELNLNKQSLKVSELNLNIKSIK